MKYNVTVDYVTTAEITVEADGIERAAEFAQEQFSRKNVQTHVIALMKPNLPDGLSIAMVEPFDGRETPRLLLVDSPGGAAWLPYVVDEWCDGGDESRCPCCGHPHDYERREEDDGFDGDGHWIAFLFECNKCGGKWWASYYLTAAKLEEANR